jgi:hypothetical protein
MASSITLLIALNVVIAGVSCNHNGHAKINQEQNNSVSTRCDTMTKESFFILARKVREDMDSRKEMSFEQATEMVKVYNTLHLTEIANDEKQSNFSNEFTEIFLQKHLNKIVQVLECSYGKGMTIYSRKHDLYVGIGTEFRCKDVYTIV